MGREEVFIALDTPPDPNPSNQRKLMKTLRKMQEAAKEYLPIGLKMALVKRPNPEFMWWMNEITKFTPDIATLEEYHWQLIFTPDELKRDHVQHHRLGEDSKFKFPAFTVKKFHYWNPKNPLEGMIPMALVDGYVNPVPWFPPVASIKGEIYMIRPQRFLDIDRYYQNGIEYQRHRIRLVVPYRSVKLLKDHTLDPRFGVTTAINRSEYVGSSIVTSEEITCIIRAWMYIGKPSYWDPLLNSHGYDPVETFTSKNRVDEKGRRWLTEYYSVRRPPLPPK